MCCSPSVPRGWGWGDPQRLRTRPRRGSFQCPRWTKDRGDCRRVDLVAGSPVGNRHHVGVSSPAGWDSEEGSSKARRRGSRGSAAQERDHIPGVGEGGQARLVVLAAETGGGLRRRPISSEASRRRRQSLCHSAGKAFAPSLLDRRPNPGTGASIPSGNEVVREDRFA